MTNTDKICEQLLTMADPVYKDFHSRLIPTVNPQVIIGIRTPVLRKYARTLAKQPEAEEFLCSLPHVYYEENNLHGFLLESLKDYERCIQELDRFLPLVDNWATCDMMSLRILKTQPKKTLKKAKEWMNSSHTYVCRFGIKVLMDSYLEEYFSEEIPELVANIRQEEYYVKMMQAWFFATALAKRYEAVLPLLERKCLPAWVQNKTIQKARESYRISPQQKEELKALKMKL